MQDTLSIIFLGWPAIIGSLLLTLIGLAVRKPVVVAIGAALLLPFSFFLTRTFFPAIILPLFQFGAAFALWRGRTRLAWLLLTPLVLAIALLIFGASRY
jgi:hypothetical protein